MVTLKPLPKIGAHRSLQAPPEQLSNGDYGTIPKQRTEDGDWQKDTTDGAASGGASGTEAHSPGKLTRFAEEDSPSDEEDDDEVMMEPSVSLSRPPLRTQQSASGEHAMRRQGTFLSTRAMSMAAIPVSSVSQLLHQPSTPQLVKQNTSRSEGEALATRRFTKQSAMKNLAPVIPKEAVENQPQRELAPLLKKKSMTDVTFGKYDTYLAGNPRHSIISVGANQTAQLMASASRLVKESAAAKNSPAGSPAPSTDTLSGDSTAVQASAVVTAEAEKRASPSLHGISLRATQLAVQFGVAAGHAGLAAAAEGRGVVPRDRGHANSISGIQENSKHLLNQMKRDNMGGVKLLLSSDKPIHELVDLAFDEARLRQVVKKLSAEEQKKQKRLLREEEFEQQQKRRKRLNSNHKRLSTSDDMSSWDGRARRVSSSGHPTVRPSRDEFLLQLESLPEQARNAMIISRLALAMQDIEQRTMTWEQRLA